MIICRINIEKLNKFSLKRKFEVKTVTITIDFASETIKKDPNDRLTFWLSTKIIE